MDDRAEGDAGDGPDEHWSSGGGLRERRALPQSLELGVAQLDLQRRQVLLKVLERERAGDRQRRRRAPQEPRERDLRRGRAVAVGDLGEPPAPDTAQRKERNEHDPFGGAVVDELTGRVESETRQNSGPDPSGRVANHASTAVDASESSPTVLALCPFPCLTRTVPR